MGGMIYKEFWEAKWIGLSYFTITNYEWKFFFFPFDLNGLFSAEELK
jgi:hypothetical protein